MTTVSIVLPTFNRTKFLRLAIESVYAQTHADWQLIIVDDGSGDETREFLRGLRDRRIKIVWLEHCGNPSRVRNVGIDVADGKYLAFLDSDDLWLSTKLEKQLNALRDRPDCHWSYTVADRIDARGQPLAARPQAFAPHGWIFESLLRLETRIAMPTVVAERELIRSIGGFDEEQRYGEFQDLCLRLATRSSVASVPEALCSIRAHDEHYSGDRALAFASWMRLYEKTANRAPDERTRRIATHMRSGVSLQLARIQSDHGEYANSIRTLLLAFRFSWRFPGWWYGAVKRLLRLIIPNSLRASRQGEL